MTFYNRLSRHWRHFVRVQGRVVATLRYTLLFMLLLVPQTVWAEETLLSCIDMPHPNYSAIGQPPLIEIRKAADLATDCSRRMVPKAEMLISVAGRFRDEGGSSSVLARFAAVSQLLNVRYWSVSRGGWTNLFTHAVALDAPDLDKSRPDFSIDEVRSGRPLYFSQRDNLSSNDVIYRMILRWIGDNKFVVEIENVTPIWFYAIRLSPAHAARSLCFLEQSAPGVWSYSSLTEVGAVPSLFMSRYNRSLTNRAVALFRHVAGIPTDRDPPVVP